MNTSRNIHPVSLLSLAALVGALASPAIAAPQMVFEGDGYVPKYDTVSTKTRDQVRTELFASRAQGDWVFEGDGLVPRTDFVSKLSRAEVLAELRASQIRGDWVFEGDGYVARASAPNHHASAQQRAGDAAIAAASQSASISQ